MHELTLFIFTQIISTDGFVVATLVVGSVLVLKQRQVAAGIFFVCTLGLMCSVQALKLYFHIPRPSDALVVTTGYAFPSGHAGGVMFLAVCLGYLATTVPATLRALLWILLGSGVLLVGASRLVLGVHTPFQVLVGYVLGAVWAGVYVYLVQRFR